MSGRKYKVVYSPAAREDLRAIYLYISGELFAPMAAKGQVDRIRRAIRSLDFSPERHASVDWEPWASASMHQMPVSKYNVFYMIDDSERIVKIIRIFYSGRDVEHMVVGEEE